MTASIKIVRTSLGRRIRNHLDQHRNMVAQSIARQRLELGLRHYGRNELEAVQSAGGMLAIQVLGLVVIAEDVTPELARATIASIRVLGALQATHEENQWKHGLL